MNTKDKIKLIFSSPQDVFKVFHINPETGYIYKKSFWDKGIEKKVGRPTTDKLYVRVNVECPNLTHIFKRGYTDVSAHRLIYYAFTGKLPEKVDHKRKDIEYLDALTNLRESDSFHNRLNTNKIKKNKTPEGRATNKRKLEQFRGIYYAYKYYWALYDSQIINPDGFISPLLAVNYRNNYIKELYFQKYGSLDNFPSNALDSIDENELFLDQMSQETIEKTQQYKDRQKEIKINMKKKSEQRSRKKIKDPSD